jgi:hypothetical protein
VVRESKPVMLEDLGDRSRLVMDLSFSMIKRIDMCGLYIQRCQESFTWDGYKVIANSCFSRMHALEKNGKYPVIPHKYTVQWEARTDPSGRKPEKTGEGLMVSWIYRLDNLQIW